MSTEPEPGSPVVPPGSAVDAGLLTDDEAGPGSVLQGARKSPLYDNPYDPDRTRSGHRR